MKSHPSWFHCNCAGKGGSPPKKAVCSDLIQKWKQHFHAWCDHFSPSGTTATALIWTGTSRMLSLVSKVSSSLRREGKLRLVLLWNETAFLSFLCHQDAIMCFRSKQWLAGWGRRVLFSLQTFMEALWWPVTPMTTAMAVSGRSSSLTLAGRPQQSHSRVFVDLCRMFLELLICFISACEMESAKQEIGPQTHQTNIQVQRMCDECTSTEERSFLSCARCGIFIIFKDNRAGIIIRKDINLTVCYLMATGSRYWQKERNYKCRERERSIIREGLDQKVYSQEY